MNWLPACAGMSGGTKSRQTLGVMPGLDPGIHVLGLAKCKTWMAGTSPAMTRWGTSPAMTAESAHSSPLMIRTSRTAPSPSARSASW